MSWQPETKNWPGKSAVLFVHGVGNTKPGDYDPLIQGFLKEMGEDVAGKLAVYFLYYDDLNDQFAEKSQLADGISKIKNFIKQRASPESGDDLSEAIAEYSSDVIFPVLSEAARTNTRERYLTQVLQMRKDGHESGVQQFEQKISIICHSMGCFHTYEALHEMATNPDKELRPATNIMQFANVIYMAAPVQLIRSVSEKLGAAVSKKEFAGLSDKGLFIPFEKNSVTGQTAKSTNNWVSITGNLDPVGGYFFKKRANWAYLNVEDQESIIDDQSVLNINSKQELASIILNAKNNQGVPSLNNPHSWDAYIQRHTKELKIWMSS